jgi:RNA polymerase primary sigma factor
VTKDQTNALTATEEALFQRVSQGDELAEQELLRSNLPLVRRIASQYKTPGADFDDLVQEGSVGLLRAIRKFEPSRGFRFSTHAHWWIRQAISRFVKGPTRMIRLPEYVHDDISRLHQSRETHRLETGSLPSEKELESSLAWREGRASWLERLSRDAGSLDSPVKGEDSLSVVDSLPNPNSVDPAEAAGRNLDWERVVRSLGSLPPRQTQILAYRYGIADGKRRSLNWVGSKVGLSPERVRQLQVKALRSLRTQAEGSWASLRAA